MTTSIKKRILLEIDDIPDNKANSILDYILFLKYKENIKIPNEITEQTFKDSDNNQNINAYSSLDNFFQKMEK
ncbi:MAG TPA: hypothetical protein PLG34_01240 [Spirochaetota bacterium]|jgi:hypothetical protein|nr:MAG: hypothetical protein BWX91_00767 [Spirochaetes bacterium ADurb.Bin133]HNZ26851.1 hypothetical protein [Spirochaetota bacterium]HPY86592.1 hypothetical protein [Spirochaetota bacterium]HQB60220.1 hypothetical protein [Spirochaetota bacterium]